MRSGMQKPSYALISACRNEEAYIEGLVETIAAQTVRPTSWIIVDDGSTDATCARAVLRARELPFVQVASMPGGRPRSFASQVYAAQHGWDLAKDLPVDFVGFLDADIRIAPDYYERLLSFFQADFQLGLGGGAVIDQYPDRTENIRHGSEDWHVAGGVQFFRRECFEQIGGYVPIEGGGQDTIADVMALMRGWRIRTFPELTAMHLRPDGFAKDSTFARGIKWGRKFYLLGYHPLFYFGQCLRRIARPPVVVGSLCQLLGFLLASLKGETRPVSRDFVRYLRCSQMRVVRTFLAAPCSGAPRLEPNRAPRSSGAGGSILR